MANEVKLICKLGKPFYATDDNLKLIYILLKIIPATIAKSTSMMQESAVRNAHLNLRLVTGVIPRKAWRVEPTVEDIGYAITESLIEIPLGDMEPEKEHAIIIECAAKRPCGMVRIAHAELKYDIPSLEISNASVKADLIVEFVDPSDPRASESIDQEICDAVKRAGSAEMRNKALNAEQRGQRKSATILLNNAPKLLGNSDPEGAEKLREMKVKLGNEEAGINDAQFIEEIAKDSGLTIPESKEALEATLNIIKKCLKKGEEVRLIGFGTFSARRRKARKGINQPGGEQIQIKPRREPHFSPGAGLKDDCLFSDSDSIKKEVTGAHDSKVQESEHEEDIGIAPPEAPGKAPIDGFLNESPRIGPVLWPAEATKSKEHHLVVRHPRRDEMDTLRDWVDCSVFAPASVRTGSTILVQVFAHLMDQAETAEQLAKEFDKTAGKRGFKSLEMRIARGQKLTFNLVMPGLEVENPVQSLIWHGRPEAVQFGVRVPPGLENEPILATVYASLDSTPLGCIKFWLAIHDARTPYDTDTGLPTGDEARHYKKAFISYSRKDQQRVQARVRMLEISGLEYFQDVSDIKLGANFSDKISQALSECDLFLLFWSREARKSRWVRREVQFALDRKSGDDLALPDILPIILESKKWIKPWKELEHINFTDMHYLLSKQ